MTLQVLKGEKNTNTHVSPLNYCVRHATHLGAYGTPAAHGERRGLGDRGPVDCQNLARTRHGAVPSSASLGGVRLCPQPRDGGIELVDLRLLLEQLRPLRVDQRAKRERVADQPARHAVTLCKG